jgi:hypothetical protein
VGEDGVQIHEYLERPEDFHSTGESRADAAAAEFDSEFDSEHGVELPDAGEYDYGELDAGEYEGVAT